MYSYTIHIMQRMCNTSLECIKSYVFLILFILYIFVDVQYAQESIPLQKILFTNVMFVLATGNTKD